MILVCSISPFPSSTPPPPPLLLFLLSLLLLSLAFLPLLPVLLLLLFFSEREPAEGQVGEGQRESERILSRLHAPQRALCGFDLTALRA